MQAKEYIIEVNLKLPEQGAGIDSLLYYLWHRPGNKARRYLVY